MTEPPATAGRFAAPEPLREPSIVPFGEAALLATYGQEIDAATNAVVHRLAAAVRADDTPWRSAVPGYASLVVCYDPLAIDHRAAASRLAALAREAAAPGPLAPSAHEPAVEIVVRYGGDDGPDLDDVAARTGLEAADVIALHSGTTYEVFMLGFVPGFAYLGILPEALALPRRAEPRARVPAGSVAIAERQTAVYPLATPGGWHLIGRTDALLWDPSRTAPALLEPGRRVRFRATA